MLVYILFIIGFVFLIKGADFLVDGASSIAKRLKVSDLIIGLTIVAFGTSAPELIVSLFANTQGHTTMAVGNILGSNIANILLILGLAAIIYPLDVLENTVWREIPLSLLAALILGLLANDVLFFNSKASELSKIDGLVLFIFFLIFMYYIFGSAKKQRDQKQHNEDMKLEIKEYSLPKLAMLVVGGLIGLNVGAIWVVNGAVELATALGVSKALVSLTIIAIGTSLPELVTSMMAAIKKNADIAVGNIVGSNIFNIFLILGASSIINPLPFENRMNVDLGVVIIASVLLFISMFTGRKRNLLERKEGILFLALYIAYVSFSIVRG